MVPSQYAFPCAAFALLICSALTVSAQGPLMVDVTSVEHVSCHGLSDGAITLTASQGQAPYDYAWSNMGTGPTLSNLAAGAYSCTVTDANDESVVVNVDVEEPDTLTLAIGVVVLPNCLGVNGSATVAASGGTGAYSYVWSDNSSGPTISNVLEPGAVFGVTVTDDNQCTASASVDLRALYPPTPDIPAHGPVTCTTPQLTLGAVVGGTVDYTPLWTAENGGTILGDPAAFTIQVNAAGTYILRYTHLLSGCTALDVTDVVVDTLHPIVFAGDDLEVDCSNSPALLTGFVTLPGIMPSILWTASNGGVFLDGGQEVSTSTVLNPTSGHNGTYTLTATNPNNGCTDSDALVVTSLFQAPEISVTATEITCSTPTVTLSASYDTVNVRFDGWTGPGGFSSMLRNPVVSVPGNYVVSVTDTLNGCPDQATLVVANNTQQPALLLPTGIDPLTCADPAVSVTVNADTLFDNRPYTYAWTGPGGYTGTGRTVLLSLPGNYIVVVTDTDNGCTDSGQITIQAGGSFVLADAGADAMLTCSSPNLNLDGTGSTQQPGFVYSWSTVDGNIVSGANTLTPQINAPGVYTLLITDPVGGCSSTDEVEVFEDQNTPVVTLTGTDINCLQDTAFLNAVVSPAGGTLLWTGPNGFSSGAPNLAVTEAGAYTLLATAANGCTASAAINVAVDTLPPVVSVANGALTCTQAQDTLVANTSETNLSFSWTGPNGYTASGPTAIVSVVGSYTLVATDTVSGCSASVTATLSSDTNVPVANAGADDFLNCNVEILKLNGSGSSIGPNFSYQWTTLDGSFVSGETTLSPRVDAPGTYTLVVTNTANGCTATDQVLVVQRDPVSIVISSSQDVTCFGASDGLAIATASGGTGIYQFGWSNGNQSNTAAGLSAGVYTVLAVDTEGCNAFVSVTITQPAELLPNASATAETFGGLNDGTATAAPTGGVMPYTYLWSTGATTAMIEDLAPGNYTVTVTDENGCTAVESVTVNASNCFLSAVISSTNLNCAGANNGTAMVTISGAAAPVQINWSNSATTEMISGLMPGTYTVTVTDANNCSLVRTTTITSPQPLLASLVVDDDVLCADYTNGILAASASGGTQPYAYLWSNGSTNSVNSGLGVGQYTLTITDAKGCTQLLEGEVSATDTTAPILFVQDVVLSLDENGVLDVLPDFFISASFDVACDIVDFTVTPSSFDCDDLGSHVVTLTATDINGNMAVQTANLTVIDNAFPIISCPSNLTLGLCDAFITYPQPTVSDNCSVDPALLMQTSGLPSGTLFPVGTTTQTFTYTDTYGNVGNCVFSFTILSLPNITENVTAASCDSDCDGSVSLTLGGGAPPFTIEWSTGATGTFAGNLCPGDYSYTVTDAADCLTIYDVTVGADDNQAPVLQLQLTVANLDQNGQVTLTGELFDNGSTDNCGIATWGVTPSMFNCSQIGTHTVTVTATDESGNSSTKTVNVVIADNLPPVLTCPPNLIVGACDNQVTFGQPTFSDNCSTAPANLALINGLASGSLFPVGTTIQVFQATDASTNSGTCSFTVQVDPSALVDAAIDAVTCNGGCDGSISLTLSGGNPPFTIQWSNGQTGPDIGDLCGGPITVSITDASNCTDIRSYIVPQPDAISFTLDSVVNDMGSAGVGAIQITPFGGTPPYGFLWSLQGGLPFSTSEDISGLNAGTYVVTITDATGCTFTPVNGILVDNIIAVHEPEWARGLVLAPNPATDWVRVYFAHDLYETLHWRVTDLNGRVVRALEGAPSGNRMLLELNGLPPGMYMVHLRTEDGASVVRKLVIGRP